MQEVIGSTPIFSTLKKVFTRNCKVFFVSIKNLLPNTDSISHTAIVFVDNPEQVCSFLVIYW